MSFGTVSDFEMVCSYMGMAILDSSTIKLSTPQDLKGIVLGSPLPTIEVRFLGNQYLQARRGKATQKAVCGYTRAFVVTRSNT